MQRIALLFGLMCFILFAVGAVSVSKTAVVYFQDQLEAELKNELLLEDEEWVNLRANGLRVELFGLADSETARFRALEVVGRHVEPGRIRDRITILNRNDLPPPTFSVEALRNEERISLIGLIPTDTGREAILGSINDVARRVDIVDMLEEADHSKPENWDTALDAGLEALNALERSKVTIEEDQVTITAVANSVTEKADLERRIQDSWPDSVPLVLRISSPRPVISPFAVRYTEIEGEVEMAACSADTEFNANKILRAARELGLPEDVGCDIGLGVPTPDWDEAVVMSMEALHALGGGRLTFTDADISLIANENTSLATYDLVIGRLENDLPELFSLTATLPPKTVDSAGSGDIIIPDFTAIKSPEGLVQLRGRLPNAETRDAVESYSKSLFGTDSVFMQTRLDPSLPEGWPLRVLGGLQGLAELNRGVLTVEPERINIRGTSLREDAEGDISAILSTRVGSKENYELDIEYDEKLAERDARPRPEVCLADINAILAGGKIVFQPGEIVIDAQSDGLIDGLAGVLRDCMNVKFEIQAYTDNSGSEELNYQLSQARAEALLSALQSRRILTRGIRAVGYGPENPVADNGTEEGREANRRIEIALQSKVDAAQAAEDAEAVLNAAEGSEGAQSKASETEGEINE
ncbi:MAG: OmpA family protein [Pseudomonadota bacterium]